MTTQQMLIDGRPIHGDDLLTKQEVLRFLSISSTTLYSGIANGIYPKPVKVGLRRSAWRGCDIIKLKQIIFSGKALEKNCWVDAQTSDLNPAEPSAA